MSKYKVSFFVRDKRIICVNCYTDTGRVKKSTGQITKDGSMCDLSPQVERTLDKIQHAIEEYVEVCRIQGEPVMKKIVENLVRLTPQSKEEQYKNYNLLQVMELFLAGAKDGTILNDKEKRYPDNSIQLISYTIVKLKKHPVAKVPIEELNASHFKILRAGLAKEGLSKNTIKTYTHIIIAGVNKTVNVHHKTQLSAKNMRGLRAMGEEIDYPIYFSIDELRHLHEFKFKRQPMRIAADVFVFGCFVCLRHSDYFVTDYTRAIKNYIIEVKHKKTDNVAYIPLHPIAKQILEKYDYKIPKIGYDALRVKIKSFMKAAGFDEPCLFSRVQGGVTLQEYKPKWKLTTPHTMRRSFATNAKIAGMNDSEIMKIGGWNSYDSYKRYIRLSGLDIAQIAQKHAFYHMDFSTKKTG